MADPTLRTPAGSVESDSSPGRPQPIAPIDLDLAFTADPDLSPELLAAAGPWCAPPETAAHDRQASLEQCEQSWQQLLAGWLGVLQSELPTELQSASYSLGLSLVGDTEIAALNSDWRHKNGPTDVLAFAAQDEDLSDDLDRDPEPGWELNGAPASRMPMPLPPAESGADGTPALELGDIVISLDTAARQAPEHGHSLEQELLFLASHGLLHLLGWDHPDEPSLAAMLQRQDALCSSVNVLSSGSPTVQP